ncbi:MAG: hypothetical protein AB7T49_15370 [Oligoflexales bacterium]
MANTQLKKLKRKKRLKEKEKKSKQEGGSYTYDGNKFRTERLIPLMYHIEGLFCDVDQFLTQQESAIMLSDSLVKRVYENAIRKFKETLPTLPEDAEKETFESMFDSSTIEKLQESLEKIVERIAADYDAANKLSPAELVGVLRTINASLQKQTMEGAGDRGYLEYLKRAFSHHHHVHDENCQHDH